MKTSLIAILLFILLPGYSTCLYAQHQQMPDSVTTIEVEPGDYLSLIAQRMFQNTDYWEKIYALNKDAIRDPDTIYPGQKLKVPVPKNSSEADEGSVHTENKSDTTATNQQMLEKFREAFNKVVENNKSDSSETESEVDKPEPDNSYQPLNAGGMVLDESRSKMGSDFYDIFYSNWQSPGDKFSFTITISERPTRSRGTVVMVQLDGQNVFQNRLQPKYAKIEQAANRAIQICQRYLKTKNLNNNPYAGI